MILLAWNGVNSSRVVFLEGEQTTVISEGQNTFIWPCWGRLGGQNRTQFDSYYGRLAAVHFKTTFIWSGWDVQVWNFLSARAPYKCRAPLHCSDLHHMAAAAAETLSPHGGNTACKAPWPASETDLISLNFSSPSKKISRRDDEQQVCFRKQSTNGLLSSLRIRHTACSGFGEILHTSISRQRQSLVLFFQGSVLGTSPALTGTKEGRLQPWSRGRTPRAQSHPCPCCAAQHTGIKAGVLTWRRNCTRGALPVDLMGLFQSRMHVFKAIKRWTHNEAKEIKKLSLQSCRHTHTHPFHTPLKKQPYLCPCAYV